MRRRLTYVVVWAVATASTIGVSYWGIRSVLDSAGPERSAPLSAAELRRAAPSPTPSPSPSLSPSPSPSPPPPAPPSDSPTPEWVRAPSGPGQTRVFPLEGGTVTMFCNRGDVHVTGFTPVKGFTQSERRFSPDSLQVSFSSDRHISRVWVTWRNTCYAEVTEST